MPRRLRLAACAITGLAVVPVIAACGTTPGAAAVVGGNRITVDHLQSQVRTALVNPQAASQFGKERAEFTRDVLAKSISDQLVTDAAQARHVTVSRAQIQSVTASYVQQAGSYAALQKQAAAGGVPASVLPSFIRTAALETELTSSLVASLPVSQAALQAEYQKDIASFETADAAHILVKSKTLAQRLLAQVKRTPASFAGLAKKYSIDTGSAAKGGSLGEVGKGQTVPPFDQALFSDPIGSYVLVHSQYGYHVLHIISRTTVPFSQAVPKLKSEINSSKGTALLAKLLVTESQKVGVHVSPRYGTWNAAKQIIQAAASPVSSSSAG